MVVNLLRLNSDAFSASVNALDLASLLCSRLCHDLMSPVGALNNGIELLSDETRSGDAREVPGALSDSARATANKLKFFRLAFGAGGGFGDEIDTTEARASLEGLFGAEGKIELGWVVEDEKLPKGAIRLLLNLALLAATRWSAEDISTSAPNAQTARIELAVRAEGPRILLDPVLRETLATGGGETVEPRAAGAWLAHSLAAEGGGSLRLSDPTSDVLMIGATIPVS